jgi:hypothetical protein
MGWVVGPIVLLLFALVTYYTALLLTDCYRSPDPVSGKRNYTYMDAVKANLGKYYIKHSHSTTTDKLSLKKKKKMLVEALSCSEQRASSPEL